MSEANKSEPLKHNASHEPCDMVNGPCSCGAWHNPKDPITPAEHLKPVTFDEWRKTNLVNPLNGLPKTFSNGAEHYMKKFYELGQQSCQPQITFLEAQLKEAQEKLEESEENRKESFGYARDMESRSSELEKKLAKAEAELVELKEQLGAVCIAVDYPENYQGRIAAVVYELNRELGEARKDRQIWKDKCSEAVRKDVVTLRTAKKFGDRNAVLEVENDELREKLAKSEAACAEYTDVLNKVYNHNKAARSAVLKYYGTLHKHDCGKDYVHRSELEKAQAEAGAMKWTLRRLQIGSCSCVVKTSDIKYHHPNCNYRIISEALASECGNSYVPKAQLDAAQKQVEELKAIIRNYHAFCLVSSAYSESHLEEDALRALSSTRPELEKVHTPDCAIAVNARHGCTCDSESKEGTI